MTINGKNITDLELRVWRFVAMGYTRKRIARETGHGDREGPASVCRILYRKIGAHCAADATRLAVKHRVIHVEVMPA